jgi:hypothetical protein
MPEDHGGRFSTSVHEAGYAIIEKHYDSIEFWETRGRYRDIGSAVLAGIIATMAGAAAETEIVGYCQGGDGFDRDQTAMLMDGSECLVESFARFVFRASILHPPL